MIDYESFCKIKTLSEQKKLNPAQIAEEMKMDLRTVESWLKKNKFVMRRAREVKSRLDPFKDIIIRSLEHYPSYTAVQIYQKLVNDEKFDGSYSMVKKYVRKIRPKKTKAYLKLTFLPGECAQVDWGSYGTVVVGNTKRKLSFFVMVLCYSRMSYVEFSVSQTMEHWLACHQHAFEFFNGIPKKLMLDNLKSAVLKRVIYTDPVFNPKYLDFANHYGFDINPCNVRAGNEKGRVENGVGYVKKNFLNGLDISDFSILPYASKQWLDTIANVRIHGETKEKPSDLFQKEKSALTPLPAEAYDISTISQVRASNQFRITLDTNRYSVPAEYSGLKLLLKLYPDRLCLYSGENLIARHSRSFERHRDFENPEHPKALLQIRKKAKEQQLLINFLKISKRAEEYYQELEKRRLNPRVHVRKIVALAEIYGNEAVSRAIEDAFHFLAFSSEYIANILEQRQKTKPEPGALHLTRKKDLLELTIQKPDLSIYKI